LMVISLTILATVALVGVLHCGGVTVMGLVSLADVTETTYTNEVVAVELATSPNK